MKMEHIFSEEQQKKEKFHLQGFKYQKNKRSFLTNLSLIAYKDIVEL